jgi:cyclase
MRRVRVIPVLLLREGGLYKTVKFSRPSYIGDPINAVKIFNEKEVDELLVLDISASRKNLKPDFNKIAEIAGEAFMPMGYGGGVRSVDDIRQIIFSGFEKVVLGTSAFENPDLVKNGSSLVGAQSIVVSIDFKKNLFGKLRVYVKNGQENTGYDPISYARKMEDMGAGELILHAIDRDGMYTGYDLTVIEQVAHAVHVPLVACGGASGISDFAQAIQAGASAVAAGSVFVYRGKTRGILPNYPSQAELRSELFMKLHG